jgi:multidrug efflux pump
MAYAVMGGLVVATLLTLVFLPALYVAWFRVQPVEAVASAVPASRDVALAAATRMRFSLSGNGGSMP